MAEPSDVVPMFEQLLTLNRQVFAAGRYNTAYHLLVAALHEAENDAAFDQVQRLAEEELAVIDAAHPEYEHSTASATARGHVGIFALLAQQARARPRMSQMNHARHNVRPPGAGPAQGSP